MFQYKPPEHKCDSSLLIAACCFISDYFYGPWFVFFTKCEFDNTDMKGTVLFNGGMLQVISDIESKSYKESLFKFWLSQHRRYSCH